MKEIYLVGRDYEWDMAETADETYEYYWVETGVHSNPLWNGRDPGGKFVKCYKPSVAKLVAKRSGYKIYPVNGNGSLYM